MKKITLFSCAALASCGVFAALPTDVGTAITTLEGDMESLVGLIVPAMVVVLTAAVGIWAVPRIVSGLKRAFGAGGK